MYINLYALPSLITGTFLLVLGLFVLQRNPRSKVNVSNFLLCLVASCWLILYSVGFFLNQDSKQSLFIFKLGYMGVILVPVMCFNYILKVAKLTGKRSALILKAFYLVAFFFIVILFSTDYFVVGLNKFAWGYYPDVRGSYLHPLFVIFFSSTWFLGLILLYRQKKKIEQSVLDSNRLKYVYLSLVVVMPGLIDFAPNYGIDIYPFGSFFLVACIAINIYAVIKYRLLDIRIAITRAGLFIIVYTLVLGLPFGIGLWTKSWLIEIFGPGWWMMPLGLMALLATVGPFIYIFIERKAEDRLLKEQRRYQNTLKQASLGMTRIRNLRKLLDTITHIVTKTVRISYAAIYLYNKDKDEFVLQVSRDKGRIPIPTLSSSNPLMKWIMLKREPIIYEEVKQRMQDSQDKTYGLLEENMRLLTASVVIPSFLEDKFMGFIVLGDKMSGQIYTPDDLNVFQILASQAALAVENAEFYEEAKEMQGQIAQAEKMATIGTMADGLSHQINNRFYALSLIAGDAIDTIKLTDTAKCTSEVKEMIAQISHALERVQANVQQGGEVVRGILKYSRVTEDKFEALDLNHILNGTLEMVQYKVKLSEISIVRDFTDLPKIKGNLTQLEEVFFNFIDNAYDSIVERRTTLKEESYHGRIIISARKKTDTTVEIVVEDNGMGIKETNQKKVFTPFFTTKTSSRKGTGLGLYVIDKIITDTHKGKIVFESEHKVGTRFIIDLSIAP